MTKLEEGEMLFGEGKIEAAKKCFLEILKEDPYCKDAYNNLGVIALYSQNMEQSIHYFCESLKIDPFYKEGRSNLSYLAQVGIQQGRFEKVALLMITQNHLHIMKQNLFHLVDNAFIPFELTIVDNNSQDGDLPR